MSRAVAAIVAGLLLAASVLTSAPVRAQALQGTLTLLEQTTWRSGDTPFDIRLRVDTTAPADQVEIAATIYRRVTSRTEFAQTVQGRFRSSVLALIRTPLSDVVPDADGSMLLSLAPPLTREGVYPIRIELRDRAGSQVLSAFTTHLVNIASPVEGDPLRVGWVVPVGAPSAIQPNGAVNVDPTVATEVGVLAQSLDAHPEMAVTLLPTPETIESLNASERPADKDTIEALGRVAHAHQVIAQPYVPIAVTSMLSASLVEEADRQLAAGRVAIERALGVAPDGTVRVTDERLDDAAIAHLADRGVTRLVVPDGTLEPAQLPTTLTQPFVLTAHQRSLPAASDDSSLNAYFTSDAQPVLAAHQLLADLADIYFDHPGHPAEVVVMPPRAWHPNAKFLDTICGGMTTAPILVGATVNDLFAAVPAATAGRVPLTRKVTPPPTPPIALPADQIRANRRTIDAFATLAGSGNVVVARMERTLLVAESNDLRVRARQSYLDGVRQQVDGELRKIQMPSPRSITLTAREGEIPVTIHNSASYPMRVVLLVDSDTLEFPLGRRKVIDLVRANTTQVIRVRARASGSFPLRIRLEAPSGSLVVAETRFTIRSTATSGVGIVLSAGAAIFLVVWWGGHLRGRRSRKLVGA